jgi:hypothetical protein
MVSETRRRERKASRASSVVIRFMTERASAT